jgi:hypothetical protein
MREGRLEERLLLLPSFFSLSTSIALLKIGSGSRLINPYHALLFFEVDKYATKKGSTTEKAISLSSGASTF